MNAGVAIRGRGALQLLAPLLLLAALGFGLPAWLYAERIGQTLRQAERSRLQFTLADLKGDFEQGLAQGYGIRDLANAQSALDAEARLDPSIDAIAVLDGDGNFVSQAGAAPRPTATPTVSTALLDPQGRRAGTLAAWIGYRTQYATLVRARIVLALAALAATLFTATAAMAVMAWLARRKEEVLEAIAEGLEHPHRPGDPRTAKMVDEVNQRTATTMVEIAAARHLAQQGET
jgi:hypothetical protein